MELVFQDPTFSVQLLRAVSETYYIKCPTLVLDAEKDDSFPGQPKKVFEALTCPKKYILFTAGEEHCQCGAPALSNQRIFDWLDDTFLKKTNLKK
jgi:hypothetical protein